LAIGTQYIGVEQRPLDAIMPALPQDLVTAVTGGLVALLYLFALWQAFSSKHNDRWLIMLVAASITILMEPFACFMVKAHHPAIDAYVLLSGLDVTVPWQLLFFYILYFAPTGAYLMWRASKGVSAAGYWMDFVGIVLLLWGAEAFCIWLGVWFFFDYNPFVVAGLPIWVSLTNISAVYAWSVATSYCLDHLKGAARWIAVLAAPFAAIAVYGPVSLPGAVALYRDGAGFDVTGPACLISVLVGLGFIAGARHLLLLSAGRLRRA
tara:strand:- start:51681 stop:52475 length:795 start_codon:yes stop_codon:yes gene_type:complete